MPVDDLRLDEAHLAALSGSRFARVTCLPTTTSTNSALAAQAREGAAEGTVLVADYQTRGRGRLDRSWEAPPGTCLLMSVLMRPSGASLPPTRRHLAVAALSLAVCQAATELGGRDVRLKWPNDVVAGPGLRKLAGVLAESPGDVALVVGAGVNVSWAPPGLHATSLEGLTGHRADRAGLLVAVLRALDRLYGDWEAVARLYSANCATIGRAVRVDIGQGRQAVAGLAEAVDEEGALLVRDGAGNLERVVAGDVVHASHV